MTHIIDGIRQGFEDIVVRAGDTDVLIILTAYMPTFLTLNPKYSHCIILDFGKGTSRTDIDVNQIALTLGLHTCKGMLFLHSLSGCDYSSKIYGTGKTRWLELYRSDNPELAHIPEIFKELSSSPTEITSELEQAVTKFILLVYHCSPGVSLTRTRMDYLKTTPTR